MEKVISKIPKGILDNLYEIFGKKTIGISFPTLYFSDEEPEVKTYGVLKEEEFYEELRDIGFKYKENNKEELLSDQFISESAYNNIIPWMLTYQNVIPGRIKKLGKEVKDVLAKREIVLKVESKYDYSKDEIIIYKHAFDECSNSEIRKAAIRRAIAREVFNSFYYKTAPATYLETSNYAKIVKESLAEFFSYELCLDKNASKVDEISESNRKIVSYSMYYNWKRQLFVNIPSAYAIFFLYQDDKIADDYKERYILPEGSLERFVKIFEASEENINEAYHELVPDPFKKISVIMANKKDDANRLIRYDNFHLEAWNIIKDIIKENNINSISDLQEFFPSDVLKINNDDEIKFENGEILYQYSKWEIVNKRKFVDFVKDKGYNFNYTFGAKTLISVKAGDTIKRYLFDPYDEKEIDEYEDVYVLNEAGEKVKGYVISTAYFNDEEYLKECVYNNIKEFPIAKRCEK